MEILLHLLGTHGYFATALILLPMAVTAELFNFLPLRAKRQDDEDLFK